MFPPKISGPGFDFNPWGDDDTPYELNEKTAHNTEQQLEILKQMQKSSEKQSKIEFKRFCINFILALIAAVAAVTSVIFDIFHVAS